MNKGILYTVSAYSLWGVNALYFKLLQEVSPMQILAHRVVWSFALLAALLLLRGEFRSLFASIRPRTLLIYLGAGALLTLNWLIYIWAVNTGHLLESSLGYFINPLVNIVLGLVFLKEKLQPLQWLAVGLAAGGVAYQTVVYGTIPWISLALAVTFGLYGLFKKIAPFEALPGLWLETAIAFLPALADLFVLHGRGQGAFGSAGLSTTLLLMGCGVITSVPLLLFAQGARTVALSTMGLIQYISPTIQFLAGVFLFHEAFSTERAVGFVIIWGALIIFTGEGFSRMRRPRASSPV
ncbi:MAG: EamA family transporter RarD [Anaerolineaceae bacterium]|nr:EamA family transporter RarD [Anaerolineaceae bacterium]